MSIFKKLFKWSEISLAGAVLSERPEVMNAEQPTIKKAPYDYGKNVLNEDNPEFDLLTDLIDYLLCQFEDNGWNESAVLKKLPDWYEHSYLAWQFNNQVLNGGVLQYFYNKGMKQANRLAEVFKAMNEPRLSHFLDTTIRAHENYTNLESTNPSDEVSDAFLEANHHKLDMEYYGGLEDALYEATYTYIRNNLEKENRVAFVTP